MIIKRNFNPIRVAGYIRTELITALIISTVVWIAEAEGALEIALPFAVSAILGSALAIFIAFRNNSSYARWWEARTLWGGIINSSRVIARLVITFSESHRNDTRYDEERTRLFQRRMIYSIIAWAHALRIHLRRQQNWDELRSLLTEEDFQSTLRAHNKPNHLQLLAGRKIYDAMSDGILAGFDSFQLEGQLLALANYQGGCERIKNTPLLRQYDFFTRVFLFVFIGLLPLCLIGDFSKAGMSYLVIPVSVLISFVFSIIGKVGEVNEDPFENRITDVPLTALCTTIERDLREMLGEQDLPPRPEPVDGFLY